MPPANPLRSGLLISFAALVLCGCVRETPSGLQPAKPDLEQAAHTYTQLGLTYASEGMLDLAEVKLKKAIEEDSSIAQAHSGLGFVYSQRGNVEAAQAEYSKAVELDGNDPEIRNNYGVFLCSQKRYQEGDQNFALALKNRNYATPAKGWTNAGICARQAKDAPRAESDFRQALQLDPNFPGALAEMASLSYEQQNYLRARAFLDRYMKVAPPTASVLLLGVNTERALGNDDAAHQYELKLVRNFPDSDEAAKLLKQRSSVP
ncbi:MAG: type IV pilus biogenesis/stability protein PilW [Nevskia sp.]|nr:type IV pilus biogenesis/stability protein PilW [Nevskia sp.]